MTSSDFLSLAAETYPSEHYGKIEITAEDNKILLRLNGCIYTGKDLDECVNSVKSFFSVLWLEYIQKQNSKIKNG